MKFECNITEKEFKKILFKKRSKTNAIYLTLFSILFFIICFKFILNNFVFMMLLFLFSLIIMIILLYIINIIFTNVQFKINNKNKKEAWGNILVEASDNALIEKGNFSTFQVNYKDVIYSKFKKDYFIVVDKNTSLLLKKDFFEKNDDFDKLSKFIKEKVKVK